MNSNTVILNGRELSFSQGDTLLDVAAAAGEEILTLCHEPRLKPVGACRTCLVEIKGVGRLAPSCMIKAEAGMEVCTNNERIVRHQKALLALYMSDNVSSEETGGSAASSDMHQMAKEVGAPTDWPAMKSLRDGHSGDRNPYVDYRAELCILCARCTRYCEEIESVSAITLSGRGAATTISTVDSRSLLDTSCELCGGCIAVCPTGAMTEKKPLSLALKPAKKLDVFRTTCNYCGVGCQLELNVDSSAKEGQGVVAKITSPDAGVLPNDGNLCVKGRFAYQFIDHPERLTMPLVRGEDGEFKETPWPEALEIAARGLQGVADKHGPDSLGLISSSRCTGEENYLVQKLSRAVFGTNNVHQCSAT